jgi:hypothetical protein
VTREEGARTPPHDLEAEEAALGAMLLSRASIEDVLGIGLNGGDFYKPANGHIFNAVVELHTSGQEVDPITVAAKLKEHGRLGAAGGRPHLLRIQGSTPASTNAVHYAAILQRHAHARRALAAAGELLANLYDGLPWQHQAHVLAELVAEDVHVIEESSWSPVDVGAILDGTFVAPVPTLLERNDGEALFYPGLLHSVSGEPESGKTWLALHACAQVLTTGGTVAFIDEEDTANGVIGRLRAQGVSDTDLVRGLIYIKPEGHLTATAAARLDAIFEARTPELIVIDGVTEAMTLAGLDLNSNADVARWYAEVPRRLLRHGAAVVLIDHVVKVAENRGRYAIGAQHKLAGVSGAAFVCEVLRPFGRGRDGVLSVTIAKDRPGELRRLEVGKRVAELHVKSSPGGTLELELRPPPAPGTWKPTGLMAQVARVLEDHAGEPLSERDVLARITGGKTAHKRAAIAALIDEGYVTTESGPRGATLHTLARPSTAPPDPTDTSPIPSAKDGERHLEAVPDPTPDPDPELFEDR